MAHAGQAFPGRAFPGHGRRYEMAEKVVVAVEGGTGRSGPDRMAYIDPPELLVRVPGDQDVQLPTVYCHCWPPTSRPQQTSKEHERPGQGLGRPGPGHLHRRGMPVQAAAWSMTLSGRPTWRGAPTSAPVMNSTMATAALSDSQNLSRSVWGNTSRCTWSRARPNTYFCTLERGH